MTNAKDTRLLAFSDTQNRIITSSLTLLCCMVLVVAISAGVMTMLRGMAYFLHIIGPVIVAFYLSLLTRPWYARLLRWVKGRTVIAVILFALSFLIPILLLGWLFGTFINEQLHALPSLFERVRETLVTSFPELKELIYAIFPNSASEGAQMDLLPRLLNVAGQGLHYGGVLLSAGTTAFLWLLTFFYWIIFVQLKPFSGEQFSLNLPFLGERHRHAVARYFNNFNDIMVSYFRGQTLDVLIQGCLYGTAFQIVGLPSGFIIGFVVGLLNLVPYLGAIVGFCFTLPLAFFSDGFDFMLLIVAIICCIQTFDGYVMQPYIQGQRMKLSSWQVVFALLFWTQLGGFLGILVAIPLTAFVKASWGEWRDTSERFIAEEEVQ